MRTYTNQFPRYCWLPRALANAFRLCGWVDTSWGNDAAPSFGLGSLRCWCECKARAAREIPGKRYVVVTMEGEEMNPTDTVVFTCERTADLIRWLLTEGDSHA